MQPAQAQMQLKEGLTSCRLRRETRLHSRKRSIRLVVRKRVSGISCRMARQPQYSQKTHLPVEDSKAQKCIHQRRSISTYLELVMHLHKPVDEDCPHVVINVSLLVIHNKNQTADLLFFAFNNSEFACSKDASACSHALVNIIENADNVCWQTHLS